MQDRSISIANILEILQSCTNPSIYLHEFIVQPITGRISLLKHDNNNYVCIFGHSTALKR